MNHHSPPGMFSHPLDEWDGEVKPRPCEIVDDMQKGLPLLSDKTLQTVAMSAYHAESCS